MVHNFYKWNVFPSKLINVHQIEEISSYQSDNFFIKVMNFYQSNEYFIEAMLFIVVMTFYQSDKFVSY